MWLPHIHDPLTPMLIILVAINLHYQSAKNDVEDRKREVKSIVLSVGNIQEAFSKNTGIENIFKFLKEFENRKVMLNRKDLKAYIEEIEKTDVVLKTKVTEEKKAKLFRIQAEEELRDILTKSLCSEMSSGIKINLQEFMGLLNGVEKPQKVSLNDLRQDEMTQGKVEKRKKKEKTANFKFIERNIQLAKCGHGTLSLTENEKLRIENLLADIEDPKVKNIEESKKAGVLKTKMVSEIEKNFYAMDEETKIILNQIDQQLEMLIIEEIRPERSQSKISLLKIENEEKHSGEDEKENLNKENLKKKEFNRMKEINKLLSSLSSVSDEKINPLTVEEIEGLIQQSEQSLRLRRPFMTEEKDWLSFKPPKEVIAELVSNAKLLMPKFQYRFDEH